MKKEIRVAGVDDAPPREGKCFVAAPVFRGGSFMDGLMTTEVEVDGSDATEKLCEMVRASKFEDLRVIMLDGITLAGFNLVDIRTLSEETGLAVVSVLRKKPDLRRFLKAAESVRPGAAEIVRRAGPIFGTDTGFGPLWFQCSGCDRDFASGVIKLTCVRSAYPEPLRVAHMIATGVVLGESRGRA